MKISEAQEAVDAYVGQFKEGYWPPLTNLARLVEEAARHFGQFPLKFGVRRFVRRFLSRLLVERD